MFCVCVYAVFPICTDTWVLTKMHVAVCIHLYRSSGVNTTSIHTYSRSLCRLAERNAILQKTYEEQVMVACAGCGRTFSGQDRLDVHMRGCKASQ
jgi:hypothetical protein